MHFQQHNCLENRNPGNTLIYNLSIILKKNTAKGGAKARDWQKSSWHTNKQKAMCIKHMANKHDWSHVLTQDRSMWQIFIHRDLNRLQHAILTNVQINKYRLKTSTVYDQANNTKTAHLMQWFLYPGPGDPRSTHFACLPYLTHQIQIIRSSAH